MMTLPAVPRPRPLTGLRPRQLDGSYPFRSHRTVAEIWAAEERPRER